MKNTSKGKNIFFSIVSFIVGLLASFLVVAPTILNPAPPVNATDLEVNFMMLGNKHNGDSIYIKAGETDILVDAGSTADSAKTIKNYIFDSTSNHGYVSDNKLEYVIATHADEDHIAAFGGTNGILTDKNIQVETIIEFAKTTKEDKPTQVYKRYRDAVNNLKANGTNVYTALECYKNQNGAQRIIQLSEGIELEILYNYYYENHTDDDNDNSVCFMLRRGNEQYLFTGDLESSGEKYLVSNNNLGEVYFYKMGHHGSKTSSTRILLNVIKPKVVVATCNAFYNQYDAKPENIFPTRDAIDNLVSVGSVEHFYVPVMTSDNEQGFVPANGNIVIKSNDNGTYVECSVDNRDFFEFEIFKKYRSWG